ncbi:hypothetical protein R50073_09320 [Maricurvus nonylphenolicus]|uniref:hypothetical protein n=1 Tax=Maricurvus nonylphenolicus TaxID=1008307 RepID=UPI0036F3E5E1
MDSECNHPSKAEESSAKQNNKAIWFVRLMALVLIAYGIIGGINHQISGGYRSIRLNYEQDAYLVSAFYLFLGAGLLIGASESLKDRFGRGKVDLVLIACIVIGLSCKFLANPG